MHSVEDEEVGNDCFWACIACYFAGIFTAMIMAAYIVLNLS